MDRTTTTTDSLGIVTLAAEAFKRGQITDEQRRLITDCADNFVRILSLANRYRELTGQALPLDAVPSPTALRSYVEAGNFNEALREGAVINKAVSAVLAVAGRHVDVHALGFATR